MSDKQTAKTFPIPWGLVALMVVVLATCLYLVKMVLSDDGPRSRSAVTTVTLLKPPPPPQIKEKLPEPEEVKLQKKEEIIEPVPQTNQDNKAGEEDNTPAGDKLGLDAEGTAGSDGFGLVGKKGGRSITAGDGGSGDAMGRLSLLSKYAGYSQIVESEIRKAVMKKLDENGGIPKGKLQAVAKISLDKQGAIVSYKIIGSSGNHKMDDAVEQSLNTIKLSISPPNGMPRTITIRVTSLG